MQHSCKAFATLLQSIYNAILQAFRGVCPLGCLAAFYATLPLCVKNHHALSTHPLYYLSSLADYCGARGSEIGEFSACDHLDDEISDGGSLNRTGKDFKACRLGG